MVDSFFFVLFFCLSIYCEHLKLLSVISIVSFFGFNRVFCGWHFSLEIDESINCMAFCVSGFFSLFSRDSLWYVCMWLVHVYCGHCKSFLIQRSHRIICMRFEWYGRCGKYFFRGQFICSMRCLVHILFFLFFFVFKKLNNNKKKTKRIKWFCHRNVWALRFFFFFFLLW